MSKLAISTILLLLPIGAAFSADFYVSAGKGSDEFGEGSQQKPWQTINKAIEYVIDNFCGTTETINLYIAQGTYRECVDIHENPGLARLNLWGGYDDSIIPWQRDYEQFISRINSPDGCPIIKGINLGSLGNGVPATVEGFEVINGTVHCDTLLDTLIDSVGVIGRGSLSARTVQNSCVAEGGISGNRIINNIVHKYGISNKGIDPTIINNYVRGAEIGIDVRGATEGYIENNVVEHCSWGISWGGGELKGNTIRGCVIGIGNYWDSPSGILEHNLVANNLYGINIGPGSSVTLRNCTFAGNGRAVTVAGASILRDCIFFDNTFDLWEDAYFDVQHSFINQPGEGNIWRPEGPGFVGWGDFSTTNPIYVDASREPTGGSGTAEDPYSSISLGLASYDFHLREDSPCRSAGQTGGDLGVFPSSSSYPDQGNQYGVKIIVKEGTYNEHNLGIAYGCELEGANREHVILNCPPRIQGSFYKFFGFCGVDNTAVRGFTIQATDWGVSGRFSLPKVEYNIIRECFDGVRLVAWDCSAIPGIRIKNNLFIRDSHGVSFDIGGTPYQSCEITDNEFYDCPTGIYLEGGGRVDGGYGLVTRNRFFKKEENPDTGVYLSDKKWLIKANYIEGMVSEGIELGWTSDSRIENNLMVRNERGLNFYDDAYRIAVVNNTIWGNNIGIARDPHAWDSGGEIGIYNNVIWANRQAQLDTLIGTYYGKTEYNCIEGGFAGEGNIAYEPKLVSPAGGDFHLRQDSPCIDHGSTVTFASEDFDGEPRPSGGAPDIGADEYWCYFWQGWDWVVQSFLGLFSTPQFSLTPEGLNIEARNDIDTYGSWRTEGGVELASGHVYELLAGVSTNVAERWECPDFRLRVNFTTEDEANFIRVSSIVNGEHSPKQGELLPYSFFFEPHISGNAYVSFDLINMDVSNYSQGALCLEEISVGEVSLSGSWQELQRWEFTTDAEGWHHDTMPQHIPTIGWWEAGELKIRPQDGSNTFGSWTSPLTLNVEPSTLYRATFTVRREESSAMLCPALRFRLQDQTFEWSVLKTLVPVETGSSVPDLTPTTYNVYFYLPSGAASPLLLSLDLYNFWERSHLPYCLDTVTVHKLTP